MEGEKDDKIVKFIKKAIKNKRKSGNSSTVVKSWFDEDIDQPISTFSKDQNKQEGEESDSFKGGATQRGGKNHKKKLHN